MLQNDKHGGQETVIEDEDPNEPFFILSGESLASLTGFMQLCILWMLRASKPQYWVPCILNPHMNIGVHSELGSNAHLVLDANPTSDSLFVNSYMYMHYAEQWRRESTHKTLASNRKQCSFVKQRASEPHWQPCQMIHKRLRWATIKAPPNHESDPFSALPPEGIFSHLFTLGRETNCNRWLQVVQRWCQSSAVWPLAMSYFINSWSQLFPMAKSDAWKGSSCTGHHLEWVAP